MICTCCTLPGVSAAQQSTVLNSPPICTRRNFHSKTTISLFPFFTPLLFWRRSFALFPCSLLTHLAHAHIRPCTALVPSHLCPSQYQAVVSSDGNQVDAPQSQKYLHTSAPTAVEKEPAVLTVGNGFLRPERMEAPADFNRWLSVPPVLMIQGSIGSIYAWSVFNTPLIRDVGVIAQTSQDWVSAR